MKRVISALLALIIGISALLVYAAPDPYWALQAAYNDAIKTTTTEDDIPACEGIISYYEKLDSETACRRIISPLLKVVKIYESNGQFDKALRCYKLYKETYEYLDKHTNDDCTEALKYAESFIRQYSFVNPTVYTSAYSPADVKYFGAKNEHKVGTYSGMCGYYDSSKTNGMILYVQFETENIFSFGYKLPETTAKYMLELAWNVSDHSLENFKDIANGKNDQYIIENLKFLDTLKNCNVMLRFAAEVNEWEVNTTYAKNGKLEEFKKAYIGAFRKVSELAKTHCPNVAMVYSPNDISNMYVTATDFYPGDDYVDWVGMSSYMNKSSNATNEWSSMTDAYYNRGVYANQLMKIKDIVDAFGDRKPIMISESGFCYNSTKSSQTPEHAKEKMEFFLSYVNMVFPQVKAVFYFNTNQNGNSYQLFDENGGYVNELSKTYLNCLDSNIPIRSMYETKPQGYTRLTTINEVRDDLYLAVFASYPGNPKLKVKYTWDGKDVATATTAPYSTVLKTDKLTQGEHELKVTTTCLNTTYEQYFAVKVDNGKITAKERIIETPKVEAPKVEAPKVEEPKVEEPKVEEPKVEEPKVEEPEVEEPKDEEPEDEEPEDEEPKVEEPEVEEPEVEEPKAEEPKAEEPEVEEPEVEEPKAEEPKAEEPKVEEPKVEEPEVEEPEVDLSESDLNTEEVNSSEDVPDNENDKFKDLDKILDNLPLNKILIGAGALLLIFILVAMFKKKR